MCFFFTSVISSTANLRLILTSCIDSLQCLNKHNQLKSNKNLLQGKDAFAMYKALLFTAVQTIRFCISWASSFGSNRIFYWDVSRIASLVWCWVFGNIFFRKKENNLKMKGWSSGKKSLPCRKTIKFQILRAFLKLHLLTATIWQLCKLFTLTVYMYIFWGKILFSAKRTRRSVAMLQMDLVLLMLCDSPVFSMCFCHTLIG